MNNNSELFDIGIKLIESAILVDESIAELIKQEIKVIKKQLKNNAELEVIEKYASLIKNVIVALTLTDEKIKTGIDLCKKSKTHQ